MKVKNLANNQIVFTDGKTEIFTSYGTKIAKKVGNNVTLDKKFWDFSATTTKWLGRFLGMNKEGIRMRIASGEFKLANLN